MGALLPGVLAMKRPGEWSWADFDPDVLSFVRQHFPDKSASILDVGAGGGKYRRLLAEYPNMDALEVWEEYVNEEGLRGLYRQVHIADIRYFNPQHYNLVIFGDVIEHLTRVEARLVLENWARHCDNFLISVPYLNEQGWQQFGHNRHEEHLQPDLTREVMLAEYPMVKLLIDNARTGIFVRR